jgi:hypothetical protein
MGWWRIGSGCLVLPFPTRVHCISRYARIRVRGKLYLALRVRRAHGEAKM